MQEIAPGLFHWSAHHENLGIDVHSHWLPEQRVVLDPMGPPSELEDLGEDQAPEHAVLSCRHHWRHCSEWVERYGVIVHASRPGMDEFAGDQPVTPFDFGDEIAGVETVEVGAISPDETALHVPALRALCLGDAAVRIDADDPLSFVPDDLIGDDPEAVKHGLRTALGTLLDLEFEHLLLAHGPPIPGEGKEALRRFVEEG